MSKISYAKSNARRLELNSMRAKYPLPSAPGAKALISRLKDRDDFAVFLETTSVENSECKTEMSLLSSPFGVIGRYRRADDGDGYGLRLVVRDMNGRARTLDIDRHLLAKRQSNELLAALLNAGLLMHSESAERDLFRYLRSVSPAAEIVTVSRPGWHRLVAGFAPSFITPAGDAFGVPPSVTAELRSVGGGVAPKSGDLSGWQDAVRAVTEIDGCPHWMFSIAAGFVGPLVDLLGEPTSGVNFSGLSSGGKTTALKLAASVWCKPEADGRSLFRTWRTTDNALEVIASSSNGALVALDELGMVSDGKVVANVIYALSSGAGKGRMNEFRQLDAAATWRTFVLSSGEITLAQIIRRDRGKVQPGMTVRFPDVGITDTNRSVSRDIMTRIEDGIRAHHGHAGPAFVQALIAEGMHRSPAALRGAVEAAARRIAGEGADGMRTRAARVFALVEIAGTLALRYGILPAECDVTGAVAWAWSSYATSADAVTLDPEEEALKRLRLWIAQRWNGTIRRIGGGPAHGPVAEGWYDDQCVYLPDYKAMAAIDNTLTEGQFSRMLIRRGVLGRHEEQNRAKVRYVPGIGRITAYAFAFSEFGHNSRSDSDS